MADEITVTLAIKANKGYLKEEVKSETTTHTLTGTRCVQNVQNVGFAAHEALFVGDLATPGWSYFRNLDTTNYVEIGVEVAGTFYPLFKLLPGERLEGPLAILTPFVKANTAAVNLKCFILER